MKRTVILSVFIPFLSLAACKNGSCRRPVRTQQKAAVVKTTAVLVNNQVTPVKQPVAQCTSGQCTR